MVPGRFVALDALPLNANGKVDRDALPEPRLDNRPAAGELTGNQAPRSPAEEELAAIAGRLLNLPILGSRKTSSISACTRFWRFAWRWRCGSGSAPAPGSRTYSRSGRFARWRRN